MIRNVVVLGHSASGKTTLVEALLHKAGATSRRGSVDEGTSILDADPIEKERKFTIDASVAYLEHAGRMIQLVDTPGYRDFVGSVIPVLPAVECALVVVDGDEGIRVNTRKLWRVLEEEGVPRIIAITRLDREHARFEETLAQIRENLSPKAYPLQVPDSSGPGISAIRSVLRGEGGAGDARDALIEGIVESDEALMERYLEGEELEEGEMAAQLGRAIAQGALIPVLPVSVTRDVGLAELLSALAEYAPPASYTRGRRLVPRAEEGEGEGEEISTSPEDPPVGYVFKVLSDPFLGKLTFVRFFSGTFTHNASFVDPRTGKAERVTKLVRPQGKEQEGIETVSAGEIAAFVRVECLHVSDAFATDRIVKLGGPRCPEPMVSLAIEPKRKTDEKKIFGALGKLADECPTFRVRRDPATKELVASGMSELHLQIMLARLKLRYDVEVLTRLPRTPYLETITTTGDNHYRHKKQTGGAGEFAEVWMRIEPLPRGQQYEFVNKVVGGAISLPFVQSAEKGLKGAMQHGVISGNPVTDVKVTIYDGKQHPVDSKDIAFQKAGRECFRLVFQQARPVLLEPVVDLEVTVPAENLGDLTGDLNKRRGQVLGMDAEGSYQTIRAKVPLDELKSYSTVLGSMTGGEGTYSVEFSHYDVVPSHIQKRIIDEYAAGKEKGD